MPDMKYNTKYELGRMKSPSGGYLYVLFRKFSQNGRNWSTHCSGMGVVKDSILKLYLPYWELFDSLYQRLLDVSKHPKSAKGSYLIVTANNGAYAPNIPITINFYKNDIPSGDLDWSYGERKVPIKDKKSVDIILKILNLQTKPKKFKAIPYP